MLDIVIIGSGAAGLAAARRVQDQGATFRLLEAKPQIGGRVVTDSVTLGAPVDLGGHWLHSPALNPLTPLVDRYLFHVKQGAEDFRVARGGTILSGAEHDECFAYVEDCFEKIAAIGEGDHDCPVSELFPFRGKWHDFFEANFIAKQGMPLAQSSALDFARRVWKATTGRCWTVSAPDARRAEGIPVDWKPGPASPGAASGADGGDAARRSSAGGDRRGIVRRLASDPFSLRSPTGQQAIDDLPLGSCNKVALGFARSFSDLDVMLMPDLGPAVRSSSCCARQPRHRHVQRPACQALAAEERAPGRLLAAYGNLRQRRGVRDGPSRLRRLDVPGSAAATPPPAGDFRAAELARPSSPPVLRWAKLPTVLHGRRPRCASQRRCSGGGAPSSRTLTLGLPFLCGMST
jgi:hypothetical protein